MKGGKKTKSKRKNKKKKKKIKTRRKNGGNLNIYNLDADKILLPGSTKLTSENYKDLLGF